MNKVSAMYDKWLKSEHLRGPVVARVTMAEIAQFDNKNGKEAKYVIHFYERGLKPMILNKSNAVAMVEITGTDDEQQWCNATVMLTPSKLANGNGTIILSSPPAQPATMAPIGVMQQQPQDERDEVPF